ncbi:MAG: HNH endonuclease, partial [Synergistaceae bacterium]|nr:HNH endonuclease [Synergistaceae bacterium]
MNFLDEIFGRTELKNRIESLRQELKRCYEIRDEEKEAFNNQCIKFENKYKEAVLRIQQLEKDLNKSGISPIEPPAKPEPPKPAIGIMPEETKDVFGWVLLTDEYKEILKLLNKKEYGQKCMICKGETTLNDISLLNGRRVHKSCYDEYLNKVCSIKETDAKDYFQKNAVAVCMLKIIHSFWPTYPPDWQQRRKIVLERANNACENEECGESEDELHIHHIKELGAGGNHNLSNLKCLCVDCHNIITPGNKLGDNTIHNNSWLKRKKA